MAILRSEKDPVPIPTLAKTLGVGESEAADTVEELDTMLANGDLGLRVVRRGDRVELQVVDDVVATVRRYRGERPLALSPKAKLTLLIVMALGPLTKKEVEERRGTGRGKRRLVDVGSTLERLLEQGLIASAGVREHVPGRPRLYRATRKAVELYPDVPKMAQELLATSRSSVASDGTSETDPVEEVEPIVIPRHELERAEHPATAAYAHLAHRGRVLPTVPAAAVPAEAPSTRSRYLELEVGVPRCRPRIWRRFLLPVDATFHDLHDAIQLASGSWESFHLWEFRVGESSIGPGENQNADELASKVKVLDELAGEERCVYRYDFGDGWTINVSLNAVVEKPGGFTRKLLGGAGAWPPEDCGGPFAWRGRGVKIEEAAIREVFDR